MPLPAPKMSSRRRRRRDTTSRKFGKPMLMKKSVAKSSKSKMMMPRRIRIVYNDPDLTDSSSSDDGENCPKKKRAALEIVIPSKTVPRRVRRFKASGEPAGSPANNPRGVRRRPWGKWSAEIRNPITHKRDWLGTFFTMEEASMAYETEWRRFQKERLELLRQKESQEKIHEENTSLVEETESSHPSPSSVLDKPDPLNKQIVENEIAQEGEISEEREPSFAELFEKQHLQSPSSDMDMDFGLGLGLDLSSDLFEEVRNLEFLDFELDDVPFLSVGSCGDDFPSLDSINWEDFEF